MMWNRLRILGIQTWQEQTMFKTFIPKRIPDQIKVCNKGQYEEFQPIWKKVYCILLFLSVDIILSSCVLQSDDVVLCKTVMCMVVNAMYHNQKLGFKFCFSSERCDNQKI